MKRSMENIRTVGRRLLGGFLCGALLVTTAACGTRSAGQDAAVQESEGQDAAVQESEGQDAAVQEVQGTAEADAAGTLAETNGMAKTDSADGQSDGGTYVSSEPFSRPVLLVTDMEASAAWAQERVSASVPAYTVDADLGNVVNADNFWLQRAWREQLARDGFCVQDGSGGEFFEIYEWNRYSQTPSFVTVDSLMHSYHLYFAYLLKNIERDALYDRLVRLTDRMLAVSARQRMEMMLSSQLSDFTNAMGKAVNRNIAFFAVAKALLDPAWDPAAESAVNVDGSSLSIEETTVGVIRRELALIDEAAGIAVSPLSGEAEEMEDYSQYKPRGYYDTDEKLSRYFRAMMWYGRRNFRQSDASHDMSALLMTLAMDGEAYEDWAAIYAVTAFFAGASDDSGICEYRPLIAGAYGKSPEALSGLTVVGDEAGWRKFHELTAALDPPAINSVPGMDDAGATDKTAENKGFRFMGQRFSIDAAIFQNLIYSSVMENGSGERRMLPSALDLPAALGSGEALTILEAEEKVSDYQNYSENMTKLQKSIDAAPASLWTASLYAGWLDTLTPLLAEKGEGFPMFMQNERWRRKALETFLGSYTELKHDTVLYSKQVIAEMGGGDEETLDDRGYVEPEPIVFDRFSSLAHSTALGLKGFGMLSADAERDLERLADIARSLMEIAEKELHGELPSEEEFERIRSYGGEIEHFWQEAYREEAENPDWFTSAEFPAALVVDVATDPDGRVLQLANDNPATIFVIVPVDGTLRLARGSVYSFYQFAQPIQDRLTDHEWRVLLGVDPDESGEYHWERTGLPDKPAWTVDYRVVYDPDEE